MLTPNVALLVLAASAAIGALAAPLLYVVAFLAAVISFDLRPALVMLLTCKSPLISTSLTRG